MDDTCVRLVVARLTKWRLGLGSHREVSFAEMALPHVQLEMVFILKALCDDLVGPSSVVLCSEKNLCEVMYGMKILPQEFLGDTC